MTRLPPARAHRAAARRPRVAVAAAALALLVPAMLTAQQRPPYPTEPPPPAPLTPAQFPPFQQATLANGLKLVVVESHDQPVLSLSLAMPAGSAYDPAGKEGLAAMVAGLLDKGAGQRTAEEIAATIEGVGGTLGAGAGADFLTARASVLSNDADLAFTLLGDVVLRPTFPEQEVELARTQTLSGLQLELSQPASLAERFFDANLYGQHPYARHPTPESIRAITRDDLVAYQRARLRPQGALLVVAGDISLADARQRAERIFGGWTGTAPEGAAFPTPPQRTRTEIVLVHRPGSVQSNIVVGNTTFGPASPLRPASNVANQVLGGGSDSRLFMILREQKGWTYGAYSSFARPLGVGAFQASAEVRTAVTDSALREMLTQLRRLRSEPVPAMELEAAKGSLIGSFPLTVETAAQIAGAVSNALLYGLGTDYLHDYRTNLAAVTAADVAKVAQTAIRPDSALIVVVGDATKLYDQLQAIAPVRLVNAQGDPLTPADLTPKASSVTLDPRRLAVGSDSFVVMLQGKPFGYQTSVTARAPDGGYTVTETTVLGPVGTQHTTLTFTDRLAMRRVEQSGTMQGQAMKTDVAYANGKATGTAATPQPPTGQVQTVAVSADVPAGAIDDNAVVALLPTLPWTADAKLTLPVFAAGSNALQMQTFAVTGTEPVTVPLGTFPAYRVEVTGGQAPVTYWIEQAAPHRVLKIAPAGAPITVERAR
ncbi:MAG TPA: insulinase family protein [Gemmatimonadaceae bacterium]|nr:insulinase family protein [Gemmatimonadaceae bacterium]